MNTHADFTFLPSERYSFIALCLSDINALHYAYVLWLLTCILANVIAGQICNRTGHWFGLNLVAILAPSLAHCLLPRPCHSGTVHYSPLATAAARFGPPATGCIRFTAYSSLHCDSFVHAIISPSVLPAVFLLFCDIWFFFVIVPVTFPLTLLRRPLPHCMRWCLLYFLRLFILSFSLSSYLLSLYMSCAFLSLSCTVSLFILCAFLSPMTIVLSPVCLCLCLSSSFFVLLSIIPLSHTPTTDAYLLAIVWWCVRGGHSSTCYVIENLS